MVFHLNGSNTLNLSFTKISQLKQNFEISYLNIDAILELNRIKNEVYNEKNKLYEKLSMQGNIVDVGNHESRTT